MKTTKKNEDKRTSLRNFYYIQLLTGQNVFFIRDRGGTFKRKIRPKTHTTFYIGIHLHLPLLAALDNKYACSL